MVSPELLLPAAVNRFLNHLLNQETWARAKLKLHAGKVAQFDIGPVTMTFLVEPDGLVSAATTGLVPAVTIRIRAADLPLLLQQLDRAFSFVAIDGDADFANTISQLAQSLRWDIGDDLGKLVGDIAANRIVEGGTAMLAAAGAAQRSLTANVAEYFLDEQPMLVRPSAVEDFTSDVVRLRDDVERLAKRIGRIP